MPVDFKIEERLAGYATNAAKQGDLAYVRYSELIGPSDAFHLQRQLDQLHGTLFDKIPNLPAPSLINNLLVIIRPDLSCVAYINELNIKDNVKINRSINKGELVYISDISDIESVDIGIDIPNNCGVVFVRSIGWKRSVFFDFGPLLPDVGLRTTEITKILAKQTLLLLGITGDNDTSESFQTRLEHMGKGLGQLQTMLTEKNESEEEYQTLLAEHPWMFGGTYSEVDRHIPLDDKRIPDFTGIRCYDYCNDIIEIKQPFLKLFRRDNSFSSSFNDSWNQIEEYLEFCLSQRSYLLEEKGLKFENPKCILLLGYDLNDEQSRKIRKKQGMGQTISILTYNHLLEMAKHVYSLMHTANDRVASFNS